MKYAIAFFFVLALFFAFYERPLPAKCFYGTDCGDNLQKLYLEKIESARKSIFLAIYSLKDHKIIKALKQKAEAGVDVQVVSDKRASPSVHKFLGKNVKLTSRESNGLMHLKILITDEKTVTFGSANLSFESLLDHSNLVQTIDSPDIAKYFLEKGKVLCQANGCETPTSCKSFSVNNQDYEVWFLPDNRNASLKIQSLIDSAKKTIKIAMYTFTRDDFAKSLIDAKNRNVSVEIALDRSQSESTNKKVVQLFKKNLIPVKTNESSLLHHKMMIIDGSTLVHGSANYTKAAFTKNDDFFVIINNLTTEQQAELQDIWSALPLNSPLSQ